jgi:ribonucleoside-diphosphate reductase alpha chain
VSKGFMRGNLRLASGGRSHQSDSGALSSLSSLQRELATSYPASEGATALYASEGATALKTDTEVMYRRTTVSEQVVAKRSSTDRVAEARLRGYEGVSCSECQNFTMVRNGTCLKCDTCGSTSGCS